jgi:hypothetical protein
MAGHKGLLFLPGYGGVGCEILAAVRETPLSVEKPNPDISPHPHRCRYKSLAPGLVAMREYRHAIEMKTPAIDRGV